MTEITPSFLYWITRLKHINEFLGLIMTFSFIFLIVFMICVIVRKFNDCEEEVIKQWIHYTKLSCFIFLFTSLLFILTPTTKEAAAIYVIPKIVNNEKVQNIGKEFYDLALDWMKELHSESYKK